MYIGGIHLYPFAKVHLRTCSLYKVPKKPFFHVTTKISAVRNFLDAMITYDFIKASSYISKEVDNPLRFVNLVSDFLENSTWEYKWLIKMKFSNDDVNTHSVLVIHEKKTNDILHLHLVKEPDNLSIWKINKIEQE